VFEPKSVSVVGCGGIGSWLIPPLVRYLASEDYEGEILLFDGDTYEEGNTNRQSFPARCIGMNKAVVSAEKISADLPHMQVTATSQYISKESAGMAMREHGVCFACVDNHPARAHLARQLESLKNGLLISPANEKYDGNVCAYLRESGKDSTEHLLLRHPEIAAKTEGDRGAGCEALAAAGETQLMLANLWAATLSMSVFWSLYNQGMRMEKGVKLTDKPQEGFFDIRTLTVNTLMAAKGGAYAGADCPDVAVPAGSV